MVLFDTFSVLFGVFSVLFGVFSVLFGPFRSLSVLFGVYSYPWGGADWGGLGMWNVRVRMTGCQPVEMWWWRGLDVRIEGGRLGMNLWRRIWRCLVCMLNGQCSGICGGASFREERLTLAERGEMDVLKINDDDDDDVAQCIQIVLHFFLVFL